MMMMMMIMMMMMTIGYDTDDRLPHLFHKKIKFADIPSHKSGALIRFSQFLVIWAMCYH